MLNARQLEAFRTVILSGGVNAAARHLHVTQPAVTRLIKELEAAVGFPLFKHEGRRVCATAEALVLYQEVERYFVGLRQLSRAAKSICDGRTRRLSVCAIPTLARNFLPSFLTELHGQNSDIHVEITSDLSAGIVERVVNGNSDIGILSLPLTHPDMFISVTPLPPMAVVAILPPGHRLATLTKIQALDFQDEKVVLPGRETVLRLHADQIFSSHNVTFEYQFETSFTDITCAMVLAGAGIGLADPFSAAAYEKLGVLVRPFEPCIPLKYALIHQASFSLTPTAISFMAAFRRHLGSFILAQ